jgi:CRISPR-associated protein Csd1
MSWIQKLYETYEQCKGHEPEGSAQLLPISHTYQQAHIEITLDSHGTYESARVIGKAETAVPATEQSAGRTNTCAPHPLCDKVQYCAADYPAWGGKKASYFKDGETKKVDVQIGYETQLAAWCASDFHQPKAQAVLAYVRKGTLVADLISEKVLYVDGNHKLLTKWPEGTPPPEIFKVLTAKEGERDQGDAFIRWRVREPDNTCTAVWEDAELQQAWAKYDASSKAEKGVCMVTGEPEIGRAHV